MFSFSNFSVWVTDVFSAHHVHGVLGPGVPHEADGLPPPPLIDSVLVYPGRDFPGIFVLPSCGTEIILKALYLSDFLTCHKNSVVNAHSSEVDQTFRRQLLSRSPPSTSIFPQLQLLRPQQTIVSWDISSHATNHNQSLKQARYYTITWHAGRRLCGRDLIQPLKILVAYKSQASNQVFFIMGTPFFKTQITNFEMCVAGGGFIAGYRDA